MDHLHESALDVHASIRASSHETYVSVHRSLRFVLCAITESPQDVIRVRAPGDADATIEGQTFGKSDVEDLDGEDAQDECAMMDAVATIDVDDVSEHQAAPLAAPATPTTEQTSRPSFFVGWESEMRFDWRLLVGADVSAKQFTKVLKGPSDARDEIPMVAVWSDGFEHNIAALTVAKHRSMEKAKDSQRCCVWESVVGERTLQVRVKADREPLVWLREQVDKSKRQICQANIAWFDTKESAIACLIKVGAMAAAAPDMDKAALFKYRDELIATEFEPKMAHVTKKGSQATFVWCCGCLSHTG